jgi:hypothetical protein
MQSDFQLLSGQGTVDKAEAKKRKLEADKGETRAFLKIFETLPAQLLNAYGEARYAGMTDRAVWDQLVKPLNSGAQWMTEFAAKEAVLGSTDGHCPSRFIWSIRTSPR